MHQRVALVGIAIGMLLLAYGAFLDPFSLPFQDWDQLPPQLQQQYLLEARRMSLLRHIGICLMLSCLVAYFHSRLRKVSMSLT